MVAEQPYREILRQASGALKGRVVTLWEATGHGRVEARASTGTPHPGDETVLLDLLRGWHQNVPAGSRWIASNGGGRESWVVAPVRAETPAPPPGGRERRGWERLALELAGLCLGLIARQADAEERFRALLEHGTEAIALVDADGRIGAAGRGMGALLGYGKEEIAGRSAFDLVHPDDLQRTRSLFASLLSAPGVPVSGVVRCGHREGGWRTIEFVAVNRLHDPAVGAIVANYRDVSDQRRVEEALRASEELYRIVTESASDGILIVDTMSRIRFANPAVALMFGYQPGTLAGRPLTDLMPERLAPVHLASFDRYQRTGTRQVQWNAIPLTGRRADGREIDLEVSLSEVHAHGERLFAGILRDVTARRRAELVQGALYHISEAASQAPGLPEMLGAIHRIVGELMPARNFYIALYDVDTDTISFPYFADEVDTPPAPRRPQRGLTEFVLRTGKPLLADGKRFDELLQSGEVRLIGARCACWLGVPLLAAGRTIGVLAVQTHAAGEECYGETELRILQFVSAQVALVIERRRAEDERRRVDAELRQAQKMEEVGRLAGGIAHDFNNLLTAILSYVDFVLFALGPDHPAREDAEQVRAAAVRAAGLTRQLLAFSRRQVLQPRVLDLNAIVGEMERLLRRLIGEHIILRTDLVAGHAAVYADPSQLEQVIVNLAVNARDAMPEGGTLTLATAIVDADAVRAHGTMAVRPGRYVTLVIADTGTGMDAETQKRLFEPFFTTKERGLGTGLGLATIYGIIKQSGGYIWVESEPGRGTTFTVHLPEADAAALTAAPSGIAKESLRGQETILLVEDDRTVRDLARRTLTESGYQVIEASNGAEALQLTSGYAAPIHLLLTDVVMPGMGGRALAEALSATRPDLALLFVSGYNEDAIVRQGVQTAGIPFLQKPFTPAALLGKVREVLDSRA